MTPEAPSITLSPAHRYREVAGRRWPVAVKPAPGEILSSWLHRLAHANGVPPRYFGVVLGASGEAWSSQLDRHLPEAIRRLLLDRTSLSPEELDGLSLDPDPLSPLRLPRRILPLNAVASAGQSGWLQFCPACLRDDATPYFRRSWTLATRVSCFRHGCGLRDRCPSCGQGLAPFRRDRLVPQQYCAFCDAPLAQPTGPTSPGTRRLERLIDDLLRLHRTGQACTDRTSLPERLAECPLPVGTTPSTIPHLSHRVRHDAFRRLSEGQAGSVRPEGDGPLSLWARLAETAAHHRGLVGALADQLAETAGLQKGASAAKPDLAALLQAATRLQSGRSSCGKGRPAPPPAEGSAAIDRPELESCSRSGRSRRLSSPKAARKVSVVTKV